MFMFMIILLNLNRFFFYNTGSSSIMFPYVYGLHYTAYLVIDYVKKQSVVLINQKL